MEEKKVVNDTASFDGDVAPILPDGWKDGDNLFVDGEDELAKLLADGQETEPSIEPENDDAKPADAASTTGEADAGAVTDAGEPTEQTPPDGETKPEPRTSRKLLLKVNHDEQEVDIDAMSDDELRALLQKGKAFDAMKDAENKRTYRKVYQEQIDAGMTEAAARMIAKDAAEGNAYALTDDEGPTPAPTPAAPAAAPKAAAPKAASAGATAVNAPLPGNILKVKATQGSAVKKGDLLCVLEAMKMENEILAPADGTVTAVYAKEGTSVNTGDVLFELA